jgi:hypothetical protein
VKTDKTKVLAEDLHTDEARGAVEGWPQIGFRDYRDRAKSGEDHLGVTGVPDQHTYLIPSYNWDQFEREFNRLRKLAGKIGIDLPEWTVLGTVTSFQYWNVPENSPLHLSLIVRAYQGYDPYASINEGKQARPNWIGEYHVPVVIGEDQDAYLVQVTGPDSVKFDGWQFRAVLRPVPVEGGWSHVVNPVPGADVADLPSRYLPDGPDSVNPAHCDHCGHSRKRSATYVLQHEDGRWVQVGSTCLQAFLGQASPDALAAWLEWYVKGTHEFCFVKPQDPDGISALLYVAQAGAVVRHYGWVSGASAREGNRVSTRERVGDQFLYRTGYLAGKASQHYSDHLDQPPTAEDFDLARRAIEWARSLPRTGQADFHETLRQASLVTKVVKGVEGVLAYLPVAYAKHIERTNDAAAQASAAGQVVSQAQGQVGEKITRVLTVVGIHQYEGNYGAGTCVKFSDGSGHKYVWFTASEAPRLTQSCTVVGTVKGHKEFRGAWETTLTRVAPVKGQVWS